MSSYVSPTLRTKFESLSIDLKNTILERDVQLNSLNDLIQVLEQIVDEASNNNPVYKHSDTFTG